MKPYQQMMIADGCPAILVTMTQAERNQLWHDHPPVNPGRFIDPKLDQDRAMREQQKKDRTVIRIKKLKASVEKNKSTPMSLKGLRWDTNYSKWVPDGSGTVTQEEVEMPKLIITPYDANGLTLARGRTSVNENADQEQIDAKINFAIRRAGVTKVRRVEVTRNGEIVSTKDIPENFTLPTEAAPAATEEQQPNEGATEEADMAKKRKTSSKPKKAKAEKGYKGHRADSRKEKAHKFYDDLGPEKAKSKVAAMGIKAGTINGWFSSFKKK